MLKIEALAPTKYKKKAKKTMRRMWKWKMRRRRKDVVV